MYYCTDNWIGYRKIPLEIPPEKGSLIGTLLPPPTHTPHPPSFFNTRQMITKCFVQRLLQGYLSILRYENVQYL